MAGNESLRTGLPVKIADLGLGVDLTRARAAEQQPLTRMIDELRAGFADPPPDAAPMMRWWWFGPSVTRAELDRRARPRWPTPDSAGSRWRTSTRSGHGDHRVRLGGLPRRSPLRRRPGARARPPLRPHPGQRLVLRRPAHHRRAGGPAAALGATRDRPERRWTFPWSRPGRVMSWSPRTSGPARSRSSRPRTSGCRSGRPADRSSAGERAPGGAARVRPPDRAERQARGRRSRGPGARPLPRRGRRGAPPGRSATRCSTPCRPSWSARCSATASRSTARTGPRGCRTSSPGGVATTLLPLLHLLVVDGAGRRPGPRGLPPHAGRAVRGELRRRVPALGRRARGAVPAPELRDAAGDAQQLPVRRPVRGRGLGLAGAHPDPVGVVGRPPLRACRWSPRRSGPGCTRRPSAPPRST